MSNTTIDPYVIEESMFMSGPTKARDFKLVSMDTKTYNTSMDGAFVFLYRGYSISVSTAGLSQGACQSKIIVSKITETVIAGVKKVIIADVGAVHTVEEAIDCVHLLIGQAN